MKRKNTKRKQHDCNVTKVLDAIEKATATAKEIYQVVKPIAKAVLKHSRKAK